MTYRPSRQRDSVQNWPLDWFALIAVSVTSFHQTFNIVFSWIIVNGMFDHVRCTGLRDQPSMRSASRLPLTDGWYVSFSEILPTLPFPSHYVHFPVLSSATGVTFPRSVGPLADTGWPIIHWDTSFPAATCASCSWKRSLYDKKLKRKIFSKFPYKLQ